MADELRDWLKAKLKERHLSQNALAKHTGVGVATVNSIVRRGHTPGAEVLNKLAEYFDVPYEFIYRLAGYLPPSEQETLPDLDALQAANLVLRVKGKAMYTLPDPGDYLANDFWRIWQDLSSQERVKLIRLAETLAKEREQMEQPVRMDEAEESLGDAITHSS